MQANKGAAATIMETAANVAASAKSGLDKTRAVLEEKVEQMSTSDQVEKDMATLRKEEKIDLAETRKREAFAQNAAASTGTGAKGYTDGSEIAIKSGSPRSKPTTTDYGSPRSKPTTTDYVTEDVVGSHYPIGTTTSVVGSPKTNTTGAGSTTQVMDRVGSEKAPETNTGAAGAWQDPVGNPNTTASGLESSQTNTGTGRASMDGDRKPNSV